MIRLNRLPVLCFFIALPALAADDTDYAKLLRANGFKYCSKAINITTNWLFDQDAGSLSQWKKGDTDKHTGVLIASKNYSDGRSIAHIGATKTIDGGCDVSFSLVVTSEDSCTMAREQTFKSWKFYGEVAGLPVYDDPTTENIQVALQPLKTGCVVNKMGVFFFDKKFMLE